jgi:hypothetical protein
MEKLGVKHEDKMIMNGWEEEQFEYRPSFRRAKGNVSAIRVMAKQLAK